MKPRISTTALVTTLLGTGLLVFNTLGASVTWGEVAQTKGISPDMAIFNIHGTIVHNYYLELWTLPQRVWMTVGCLLIVIGRLGDARFGRG